MRKGVKKMCFMKKMCFKSIEKKRDESASLMRIQIFTALMATLIFFILYLAINNYLNNDLFLEV